MDDFQHGIVQADGFHLFLPLAVFFVAHCQMLVHFRLAFVGCGNHPVKIGQIFNAAHQLTHQEAVVQCFQSLS